MAIMPVDPSTPPEAAVQRKIIHCDCDCFYASVEMRDDPSLRGRPMAVGGSPDRRGVIATCNYEARAFGVRSAMSSAQAVRRCPDLLILRPAMDKYREVSRRIFAIYREYTALVEPLSLDEAYLDVSQCPQHDGSATRIAEEIRRRVREEVGVTVSAGVGPNKFVAKIASDWNKPDGLFVVRPASVDVFVAELPVGRIHGVGAVTAGKLKRLGAETCGDLRAWPADRLHREFGSFGARLYNLCRGIDHRTVSPERERKSISVEETYADDLPDLQACLAELEPLIAMLEARIVRAQAHDTIDKLTVKLRFSDFRQTTVECRGHAPDRDTYARLLAEGHARRGLPVRLLGVGVATSDRDRTQLELFP
ncbi:DNA polymerase IV [Cupriavidus pinatubonensis]|uniref:DNA polymerase IV n=1 Tax=Cupriavidus pinatubonensis TaxID=248026 RepID=UPI0011299ECC|nr:DNA polymerase IV [Cupriavidus pinatubonensis]QYY31571.1 DNA polymerase IV [Cupriavidus pinatubonensis]TPQ39458.1 DNA polymerase IV [Cupriavidus pinatubonensis]